MQYYIDSLSNYKVAGWIVEDNEKDTCSEVLVFDGTSLVARIKADVRREDLVKLKITDRPAGFNFAFDRYFSNDQLRRLVFKSAYSGKILEVKEKAYDFSAQYDSKKVLGPSGNLAAPLVPKHRSPYGGLWTDLPQVNSVIAGKQELGWINEEEAELLRHWAEFGYVIIRNAVDHELIDMVLEQWEQVVAGNRNDVWIETFKDNKKVFIQADEETSDERVKLLDLYSVSEAARNISLSSKITRFLSLVFERPPLAFQSLSFRYGTQQPIHQDTAYVKVSSPMELAASWVALEDIKPGTGELEYYPKSHTFKDFLWSNKSKWLLNRVEGEGQKFYASLHEQAKALGLEVEKFYPKKGDVLIWSADLAHGGSKIENPGTRKSLVTHYCPKDCNPYYFYTSLHSEKIKHGNGYYTFERRG